MEETPHEPPPEISSAAPTTPVMDVIALPPTAHEPKSPLPKLSPPPAARSVTKAPPKQGVGAAIAGTVVIVLGLALLAVFAYLKSH